MMKIANVAWGTLASGIVAGDTTINLTAGHGARFPATSGSDFFWAALIDNSLNLEIIKVTARATDALTVVRGQDGTVARSYSASDRLELRYCNVHARSLQQEAITWTTATGTDTYAATLDPVPKGYNSTQLYAIKLPNANTITTPTLNLNALGAITIKRPDGSALYVGDIRASHYAFLLYDGTDFLLLNPNHLSASIVTAEKLAASAISQDTIMINGTLVFSRTGNAETVALKTRAGADPSATDPVHVVFRNATLTTGDYTVLTVTSAQSITIPNTATMGCVNSQPFRIWVVAFNDGGTFRLGVIKAAQFTGGSGYVPQTADLRGDRVRSATAIGTGADAALVFYAGQAITDKPMVPLGWAEWSGGLAAVGVWNTVPSEIQLVHASSPYPGEVIHTVTTSSTEFATGATVIPHDDTAPTIGEGDSFISVSGVTPSSPANISEVHVQMFLASSQAAHQAAALFDNSSSTLLTVTAVGIAAAADIIPMTLTWRGLASPSLGWWDVRSGPSAAGTTTFNGAAGARLYGATAKSWFTAKDIMT